MKMPQLDGTGMYILSYSKCSLEMLLSWTGRPWRCAGLSLQKSRITKRCPGCRKHTIQQLMGRWSKSNKSDLLLSRVGAGEERTWGGDACIALGGSTLPRPGRCKHPLPTRLSPQLIASPHGDHQRPPPYATPSPTP